MERETAQMETFDALADNMKAEAIEAGLRMQQELDQVLSAPACGMHRLWHAKMSFSPAACWWSAGVLSVGHTIVS